MVSDFDVEGVITIDIDRNSFVIERGNLVYEYDLDDEAEWLANMIENGLEYEVYGQ